MDDLDTSTVPSGPTTGASTASNGTAEDKRSLMDLMTEKTNMEAELSTLGAILDSHGVNMNTSLTTFDGYPRDDIPVASIRLARARIINLRNDYKALMSMIEVGLHQRHAEYRASQPPPSTAQLSSPARNTPLGEGLVETPFARVDAVVPGGPADQAGLKAGDKIRRFGDATWVNHENLARLSDIVRKNQGTRVVVKVVRESEGEGGTEELELILVPRSNWGGRGLLACYLLPL
ncbi:MAG: hypothetical protein Q9163_006481 [Psora crenata]